VLLIYTARRGEDMTQFWREQLYCIKTCPMYTIQHYPWLPVMVE